MVGRALRATEICPGRWEARTARESATQGHLIFRHPTQPKSHEGAPAGAPGRYGRIWRRVARWRSAAVGPCLSDAPGGPANARRSPADRRSRCATRLATRRGARTTHRGGRPWPGKHHRFDRHARATLRCAQACPLLRLRLDWAEAGPRLRAGHRARALAVVRSHRSMTFSPTVAVPPSAPTERRRSTITGASRQDGRDATGKRLLTIL